MAYQDHIAVVVCDDDAGMSGCIIKKLFHLLYHFFIWVLLLGGNGPECRDNSWIDCPCVVEESTRNPMDEFFSVWGERWGSVSVVGLLSFCAIYWFDMGVGLVLGFARVGVVVAFESSCHIC